MPYDPDLAARIRTAVPDDASIHEKKLFGGLAFLHQGNLAVSAYKDGGLMIRCSAEDWPTLCEEDGARPMTRKGKPVSGWVLIAADCVTDGAVLQGWVDRGLAFARAQPPK